jgi:hypothetical protein
MNIVGPILRLFSVLVSSTVIGAIPVYRESFQCVIDHVMILFCLYEKSAGEKYFNVLH